MNIPTIIYTEGDIECGWPGCGTTYRGRYALRVNRRNVTFEGFATGDLAKGWGRYCMHGVGLFCPEHACEPPEELKELLGDLGVE